MCDFCDALESWERAKGVDVQHPDRPEDKYLHEMSVALVVRSWWKSNGKRSAGRITDYRTRGCGYKLNFCPECGRKLGRVKG